MNEGRDLDKGVEEAEQESPTGSPAAMWMFCLVMTILLLIDVGQAVRVRGTAVWLLICSAGIAGITAGFVGTRPTRASTFRAWTTLGWTAGIIGVLLWMQVREGIVIRVLVFSFFAGFFFALAAWMRRD